MADQRANYFPFVDINNVSKAYDHINFRDFAISSRARR